MYTMPHLYGLEDKLVDVDMEDVAAFQARSVPKAGCPCEIQDVFELTCLLMAEYDWESPRDGQEALDLYIRLRLAGCPGLGLVAC